MLRFKKETHGDKVCYNVFIRAHLVGRIRRSLGSNTEWMYIVYEELFPYLLNEIQQIAFKLEELNKRNVKASCKQVTCEQK